MNDAIGTTNDVSRRRLLAAAGAGSGALLLPAAAPTAAAQAQPAAPSASPSSGPTSGPSSGPSSGPDGPVPPVAGLHLQFGADASSTVVASWHTLQPVANPRVVLGRLDGQLERIVQAVPASYVDGKKNQTVYAFHAKLTGLEAGSEYMYGALHDGAAPEFGTFRTAPRGRAAFTFTSFGDQGTPTLGRDMAAPAGSGLPGPIFVNDNLGSPAAGDVVLGIEQLRPLFHVHLGDLCYANLSQDRVRTWWDFWENNTRSARNRPWMPSAGNHENERGNGPSAFQAYQTYFSLPEAAGQTEVTRGLWYAFTVGSVRIVTLNNDDVMFQDAGDTYVRGYSQGAQKAWLERELASARDDRGIDWVVINMHQPAISTVDKFNGTDLGIRQEWLPLFDKYGVDLVLSGHEHHYERTHPIRGHMDNQVLTPLHAESPTDVVDTTKGAVHMIIGGGGTSAPSNQLFYEPPQCRVIVSVGAPPATGHRPPVYVKEDAAWSAVRNPAHAYGFATFTVDPGTAPGGLTTMKVTYYDVVGSGGQLQAFETFTLRRPRRDA